MDSDPDLNSTNLIITEILIKTRKKLYNKYGNSINNLKKTKINDLIYQRSSKYYITYRELQLYHDNSEEFLKKYYSVIDSIPKLTKILKYYVNYLTFFCRPIFKKFYYNFLLQNYYDIQADVFYRIHYMNKDEKNDDTSDKNRNNLEENLNIIFDKNTRKDIDTSSKLLTIIDPNKENDNISNSSYEQKIKTDENKFIIIKNQKDNYLYDLIQGIRSKKNPKNNFGKTEKIINKKKQRVVDKFNIDLDAQKSFINLDKNFFKQKKINKINMINNIISNKVNHTVSINNINIPQKKSEKKINISIFKKNKENKKKFKFQKKYIKKLSVNYSNIKSGSFNIKKRGSFTRPQNKNLSSNKKCNQNPKIKNNNSNSPTPNILNKNNNNIDIKNIKLDYSQKNSYNNLSYYFSNKNLSIKLNLNNTLKKKTIKNIHQQHTRYLTSNKIFTTLHKNNNTNNNSKIRLHKSNNKNIISKNNNLLINYLSNCFNLKKIRSKSLVRSGIANKKLFNSIENLQTFSVRIPNNNNPIKTKKEYTLKHKHNVKKINNSNSTNIYKNSNNKIPLNKMIRKHIIENKNDVNLNVNFNLNNININITNSVNSSYKSRNKTQNKIYKKDLDKVFHNLHLNLESNNNNLLKFKNSFINYKNGVIIAKKKNSSNNNSINKSRLNKTYGPANKQVKFIKMKDTTKVKRMNSIYIQKRVGLNDIIKKKKNNKVMDIKNMKVINQNNKYSIIIKK